MAVKYCKYVQKQLQQTLDFEKFEETGIKDLLDVYTKQCRCVLELATPVWGTGLTVAESKQ